MLPSGEVLPADIVIAGVGNYHIIYTCSVTQYTYNVCIIVLATDM